MPRMPGAEWRPIPASTTRIADHQILMLHTMVGSLAGTDSYFRSIAPGVNSHFGVGADGTIWQWVDTAYRSGAALNGNYRAITVETADVGTGFPTWNLNDGSQVPAWTPAQVEACARIAAWAFEAHGIPLELVPDSKPGRRGQAYHRQGVDPYRVAGGEVWSNAYGKVCPGNRRIAQIPQVIARARQIAGGAPIVEDDMFEAKDRENLTRLLTLMERQKSGIPGVQVAGDAGAILHRTEARLIKAQQEIAALRAAVAADRGVDPAELERIIREALAESVVNVDVNVAGNQP